MVDRDTVLTYTVTYVTKTKPPRSMLDIIHHVANMSAIIDGVLPYRVLDFSVTVTFLPLSHTKTGTTRYCTISSPNGSLIKMAQELSYIHRAVRDQDYCSF
jgi:hypothetical protein